jgi:hypothetical protein
MLKLETGSKNMILSKKRLSGKKKLTSLILSMVLATTTFATGGITASASPEAAAAGVYVKQMGKGYCTLASAVDMMRSKMYMEGNNTWPNVTQQGVKSTAWRNGLLHQFTYYGMTVTYSTGTCNTKSALINLLKEHPEGIEIYIRDLPHAVLLTRYDASSGNFYVADPVYEGERTLMESWERKAGSTQAAVISTIDAYWYISSYANTKVPGGQTGTTASAGEIVPPSVDTTDPAAGNGTVDGDVTPSIDNEVTDPAENTDPVVTEPVNPDVVNDEDSPAEETDDVVVTDDSNSSGTVTAFEATRSTVQLPYVNDYSTTSFTDVDRNAWYAQSVKAAYEMAMMNGISSTQFSVNGNVTLAQTICMAARIHSIYYQDGYDFTAVNGEPWYMPYVRYTRENGMLAAKYDSKINIGIDYDQEALRVQFAEILSSSLPDDQLTAIKETDTISDVPSNSGEARYEAVYQLYNAGVLTGDGTGFKPWQTITRAEVAAVVSRIGDASLRVE